MRRARRDAATADVMTKLLAETRDEFLENRRVISSGRVLADALEQYGYGRLARELSAFLLPPERLLRTDISPPFRNMNAWDRLEKIIGNAIRLIAKDRPAVVVKWTHIQSGLYRISDAEAGRLARESHTRLPSPGELRTVNLPDGSFGYLGRTVLHKIYFSDAPKRGWVWFVAPAPSSFGSAAWALHVERARREISRERY